LPDYSLDCTARLLLHNKQILRAMVRILGWKQWNQNNKLNKPDVPSKRIEELQLGIWYNQIRLKFRDIVSKSVQGLDIKGHRLSKICY